MELIHGALIYTSFCLLCEVVFTGLFDGLLSIGKSFKAEVSLLMIFPYFVGYILGSSIISYIPHEGMQIYFIVFVVYVLEYYFGLVYRYFNRCPWKYDHVLKINSTIQIRLDVNGLITFAYLPFWFIFAKATLFIYPSIQKIVN